MSFFSLEREREREREQWNIIFVLLLKGLDELRENLISVTLTQGYMGESIPMAWLEFEDIIKK